MSELRDSIIAMVAKWGYERRAEPFELSSGYLSHDYVDAKRALAHGTCLQRVGEAILELTQQAGVEFDAAGGMTLGADPLAHAVAFTAQKLWFSVLKDEKLHGKRQRIVGATLTPGLPVLLLDDVATTGRSILDALDALEPFQVDVVMAVTLVDRGETTRQRLRERGVRVYEPLITYDDLGIEPVPDGRVIA
ncbi:MAG TPA: phosphoribosyltransferase family protein [Acidimicrobiales bacterium]|nr:phosphoribosyltransferase family protein [Acidimicrobiales bacterium]